MLSVPLPRREVGDLRPPSPAPCRSRAARGTLSCVPGAGPLLAARRGPPRAPDSRPMVRRTKIVCTLGPASWSPERIRSLIEAGMDVARINFSHGELERHAETIRNVREVALQAGRPVAVLGDLQGPKIRVGVLAEPMQLEPGDSVT